MSELAVSELDGRRVRFVVPWDVSNSTRSGFGHIAADDVGGDRWNWPCARGIGTR